MSLNWGKSLVLFFIVFLSLAVVFIIFSLRQNNDLVTQDYYEKGADYTTEINIKKRSGAYADSLAFREDANGYRIQLAPSILKRTDQVEIYFFRSSDKEMDVRLYLEPKSMLSIEKSVLSHGRYQMHVSWKMDGEVFRVTKDLMIK